ncbi:hypothetical protein [Providencia phage PSTCR6]|nr:hypothetical protein [Providencia phage PSTCR6]
MLIELLVSGYLVIGFIIASLIVHFEKRIMPKGLFLSIIGLWPLFLAGQIINTILKSIDKWIKVLAK